MPRSLQENGTGAGSVPGPPGLRTCAHEIKTTSFWFQPQEVNTIPRLPQPGDTAQADTQCPTAVPWRSPHIRPRLATQPVAQAPRGPWVRHQVRAERPGRSQPPGVAAGHCTAILLPRRTAAQRGLEVAESRWLRHTPREGCAPTVGQLGANSVEGRRCPDHSVRLVGQERPRQGPIPPQSVGGQKGCPLWGRAVPAKPPGTMREGPGGPRDVLQRDRQQGRWDEETTHLPLQPPSLESRQAHQPWMPLGPFCGDWGQPLPPCKWGVIGKLPSFLQRV